MVFRNFAGWGPDPIFCLIRLSIPKLPLIRLSRHKGSRIRLFRLKAFWSGHLQTMVQTQISTIAHTFIRECARRGYDQTQLRSKLLWSDPVALAAIYDHIYNYCNPVSLTCGQPVCWNNFVCKSYSYLFWKFCAAVHMIYYFQNCKLFS